MDKDNTNIKFWLFLSVTCLVIFILNINHLTQQYIYYDVIMPLSQSIIDLNGYIDNYGKPAFYPLWGYPFLQVIGLYVKQPELFTLSFQFGLAIVGVYYFFKLFRIEKKYYYIPFILPFFAIMSVKIPDSIIASLLLPYLFYLNEYNRNGKLLNLILAGILLGVCANFRSEYLFLPLAQFLFALIFAKQSKRRIFVSYSIISILTFIMLFPWALRSYILTDDFRFSATNGGAVAYISLGQLRNNKWGIQPFDSTAYSIAKSQGIENPYSVIGDNFFKKEFRRKVFEEPIEFLKKAMSNTLQVFLRGVYTGEYANLFITHQRRMEINNYLLAQGGHIKQLNALLDFQSNESIPILIEKFIQFIFILLLFALFLMMLFKSLDFTFLNQNISIIVISLILYRIATIAIIQYEYRHINSFYLLLFGLIIVNFDSIRTSLSNLIQIRNKK